MTLRFYAPAFDIFSEKIVKVVHITGNLVFIETPLGDVHVTTKHWLVPVDMSQLALAIGFARVRNGWSWGGWGEEEEVD